MRKIIIALFSVLSISVSCNTTVKQESQSENNVVLEDITAKELHLKLNGIEGVILDVRTPEEWQEGIIAGADTVNYYADNFEVLVQKLDKNNPIYVYCKSGGRSAKAAKKLHKLGFQRIYNVTGGITRWQKEGFPVIQ